MTSNLKSLTTGTNIETISVFSPFFFRKKINTKKTADILIFLNTVGIVFVWNGLCVFCCNWHLQKQYLNYNLYKLSPFSLVILTSYYHRINNHDASFKFKKSRNIQNLICHSVIMFKRVCFSFVFVYFYRNCLYHFPFIFIYPAIVLPFFVILVFHFSSFTLSLECKYFKMLSSLNKLFQCYSDHNYNTMLTTVPQFLSFKPIISVWVVYNLLSMLFSILYATVIHLRV